MTRIAMFLIVFVGAALARGASTTLPSWGADHHNPPPVGARIVLESPKAEYFLGENVLIHFGVTNTSDTPFQVQVGGDYRGASRALRFAVTAVDSEGKEASDPDPSGSCFGGIGQAPSVEPHATFYLTVPLMRYCTLDHPGPYTITIRHDLGWQETPEHKIPAGTIKLNFIMPNATQAREIVGAMSRLKESDWTYGEERSDFADFTVLRQGVYLEPMRALAQKGDTRAVEGIASIETRETTDTLVKLLDSNHPAIILAAAQALTMRLPDPDFDPRNPKRGAPFVDLRLKQRRALSAATWDTQYTPRLRALGRGYLMTTDNHRIAIGAFLLECVGAPEDLQAVTGKLNLETEDSRTRTYKEGDLPSGPANASALERAAIAIVHRGGHLSATPQTPGEQVAFAALVGADSAFRPIGWQDTFTAMMDSDLPYVRQAALASMPLPPSPKAADKLTSLISSPDLGVQYQALELAGRTKDVRYKDAVLAALRNIRGSWLVNEGDNAAAALGLNLERYSILADRLDEPGFCGQAMQHLASLINENHGGSYGEPKPEEAKRVKPLWQRFLVDHREEIQQGKKPPAGSVTAEMIPDPMHIYNDAFPNGWPNRDTTRPSKTPASH